MKPAPSSRSRSVASLRWLTIAGAWLGWGALGLQFWLTVSLSLSRGAGVLNGLVTYFSFFTILTNILVALTLTCDQAQDGEEVVEFFSRPSVRTAVAVYATVVGIGYTLLLRDLWQPSGLQLVADLLLHDIMPLWYLVWWWLAVPRTELRGTDIGWWLVYPAAYFLGALLLGAIRDVYPYPFIDAAALGYRAVLTNAAGLLLGAVVLGALFIMLGRLKRPTLSVSVGREPRHPGPA